MVVFVLFSSSMFNCVVCSSLSFCYSWLLCYFSAFFLLRISAQLLSFFVPSYLLVFTCLQGLATKVLFCLV